MTKHGKAAIYRDAAKEFEGTAIAVGTCDLLHKSLHHWPQEYARLFAPRELGNDFRSPWFVCVAFGDQLRELFGVDGYGHISSKPARNWRVLALCFMAAMLEAGDA